MTEDKKFFWEPIEIKPNDQSLVGEVVKGQRSLGEECEVLFVGGNSIFYRGDNCRENSVSFAYSHGWFIRREVKKMSEQEIKQMREKAERILPGEQVKKKENKVWSRAFGFYRKNWCDHAKWKPINKKLTYEELRTIYPASKNYDVFWPVEMTIDGSFFLLNEEPDDEE